MTTAGPYDTPVPASPTGTGATSRFMEATQARLRTEIGVSNQATQGDLSQEISNIKREISEKMGAALTEINFKMSEFGNTQHALKEFGKQVTADVEQKQAENMGNLHAVIANAQSEFNATRVH